ncbi:ATPase WRNIP1 isoform X2 [Rhinoderma darwinii]|uniref:ATPase WRNIP1 isoform X2 n=1 Tax=Rhinoderma darwinii TaxID=43563 RepID=UPI003F664533
MEDVAEELGEPEHGSAVKCPVCALEVPSMEINNHLDTCLKKPCGVTTKKRRLSSHEDDPAGGSPSPGWPLMLGAANFSLFHNHKVSERVCQETPSKAPFFSIASSKRTEAKQNINAASTCEAQKQEQVQGDPLQSGTNQKDKNLAEKLDGKPLADKLRPCTLENYMGQNKVLGENTMLRHLLQANDIPSLILWGPPGCGKTTLAHIIAKSTNKINTRFITLSATSAGTSDVREVIKQAQNELKFFKRKTVLFVDEIHRFNKTQQDTFLPHVECGTITLIGATTENPSFQVNAALLSRCRVLVLEKLSVEAMEAILKRAVCSLGIQVLQDDEQAECSSSDTSECHVYIEAKALTTLAHLCDGDARIGLNGLQLSVQSRLAAGPDTQTPGMTIKEEHIKEGLQRSHILYDRAGLADPLALPQAVSAYQACHFIGMPECDVILAQCVMYLARAPKSIAAYSAYSKVKEHLKNHKGPLPPVPLHLRNAPTKLMKNLGYGKGYKYNPMYGEPVNQDYLPPEAKGIKFV